MKFSARFGVRGHVRIEHRRGGEALPGGTIGGGILLKEYEFDNLITDYGMDAFFTNAQNIPDYCVVGSGAGSSPPGYDFPDHTNPNIGAFEGVKSKDNTSYFTPVVEYNWAQRTRFRYVFPVGSLNNVNLTEVGLSPQNDGANLATHALIEDANGQPTVITVLPTDSLMVEYWIVTEVNNDIQFGSFELDNLGTPETINVQWRMFGASRTDDEFKRGYRFRDLTLFQKDIGVIFSNPPYFNDWIDLPPIDGSLDSQGTRWDSGKNSANEYTNHTYQNGSFKRTGHAVWDANQTVTDRYAFVMTSLWGCFGFIFDPPINKPAGVNLRLDCEMSLAREGIEF